MPTESEDTIGIVLGRIEGKMEVFSAHLANTKEDVSDIETRLRRVERWTWALPVSVVSLVISAIQWKVNGNG